VVAGSTGSAETDTVEMSVAPQPLHAYPNPNSYPHANTDTHTYSHLNAYSHGYCYVHTNSYSIPDT